MSLNPSDKVVALSCTDFYKFSINKLFSKIIQRTLKEREINTNEKLTASKGKEYFGIDLIEKSASRKLH